MTLTIDVPERIAALMQADAQAHSRPIAEILSERLADLYPDADEEAVRAIQESMLDIEAGRTASFEEFVAQNRTEQKARVRAGQGASAFYGRPIAPN